MKKYLSTLLLLLLVSTNINAKLITVTNVSGTENTRAALETYFNQDLPDVDFNGYITGMAQVAPMPVKGQGSDYANDIDVFLFGVNLVGIGVAAGDSGLSFDTGSVEGMGINSSLTFGLNLGMFDLPEMGWFNPNDLRVFLNLLPPGIVEIEQDFGNNTATLSMGYIGLHARYPLIKPVDSGAGYGMAKWGGVHIHTGLEFSSYSFSFAQKFTGSTEIQQGVSVPITGDFTVGADVSSFSVPVEVSTYGQLAYFLSGYAGLGIDLGTSSASQIQSKDGLSIDSGTYTAEISKVDDKSGDVFGARYFVGLQLGAPVWKIVNIQLSGNFLNGTYGVTAGTKFTW